jgi:glutaredoxin
MMLRSFTKSYIACRATCRIIVAAGLFFSPGGAAGPAPSCDSSIRRIVADVCSHGTGGNIRPCDREVRLERFAVWLKEKDKPCSTMVNDMTERVRTLKDTQRFAIDTSMMTFAGAGGAPIRIVMYVSASCPLCKRIYHDLYDSVVAGGLKGKARLGIKPFSSRPWDLALLASRKFNRQADLMRSLAGVTERISLAIILDKADSIGIPRKEFEKAIADARIKEAADESYREAVRNGVSLTPTIFIDNRRYKSYKDPQWVADAAEYFYERRSVKR